MATGPGAAALRRGRAREGGAPCTMAPWRQGVAMPPVALQGSDTARAGEPPRARPRPGGAAPVAPAPTRRCVRGRCGRSGIYPCACCKVRSPTSGPVELGPRRAKCKGAAPVYPFFALCLRPFAARHAPAPSSGTLRAGSEGKRLATDFLWDRAWWGRAPAAACRVEAEVAAAAARARGRGTRAAVRRPGRQQRLRAPPERRTLDSHITPRNFAWGQGWFRAPRSPSSLLETLQA